jgi:hypothetical protein
MFRNNAYIDRLYPTDYSEQIIIIENPDAFFRCGSAAIRRGFRLSAAFACFLEISLDPPTADRLAPIGAQNGWSRSRADLTRVPVIQIAPYSPLTDLTIFE